MRWDRERCCCDLAGAANAASCSRPGKKSENRSRGAAIIAEVEMVRSRIVKIDGTLHETQTEKPDIKIEIPLRIAGDRSDVMKSRNFAVHQRGEDFGQNLRQGSGGKRPAKSDRALVRSGLAFVLKGQLQSSSELGHFAVLDLHIHFHNLGNAQIA